MDAGRLGTLVLMIIAGFVLAGCEQKKPTPFQVTEKKSRSDRDAPFDPAHTYPESFSDQPAYVKSPDEPVPEPRVRKDDPIHYFTNRRIVMVRRPAGYNPEELPRVSLWWSDDNGFNWTKAGYFGRGQSYFPFEVKADGDYGMRFVGPGQPPAMTTLPLPQRVYHVDTVPPAVEIAVEPAQAQYAPEDVVTIRWRAEDFHLVHKPVRVFAVADYDFDGGQPLELQRDLDREGTMSYTIPASFADSGIRIRVEALDRAGNLGLAYSHIMQILERQRGEVEVETALDTKKTEPAPAPEKIRSKFFTAGEIEARIRQFIFDTRKDTRTPESDTSSAESASVNAVEPQSSEVAIETPSDNIAPADAQSSPEPTAESAEPALIETSEATEVAIESVSTTPILTSTDAPSPEAATTDAPAIDTPAAASENVPAMEETPTAAEEQPAAIPADDAGESSAAAEMVSDEPVALSTPVVGVDCPAIDAEPLLTEERLSEAVQAPTSEISIPPSLAETAQPEPAFTDLVSTLATEETPVSIAPGEIIERPRSPKSVAMDPTRGNGLMIPMPATVYPERARKDTIATLHPWRELGRRSADLVARVWELPRPQFSVELNRMFKDQAIVDQRARPAAAPAESPKDEGSLADISLGADVRTNGDQP